MKDGVEGMSRGGKVLSMDRRQVLRSAAAVAAMGLLEKPLLWAGAPAARPSGFIDVHHHYFPPVFQDGSEVFLKAVFGTVPPAIKNWTPAVDVEAMDRNGVAMAVVSTSSRPPAPGVSAEAFRAQARQANDYGARMVQDHPTRFAQFGFLPMPDVDGTLKEIEYSLDVLKAPGVSMMTSYGDKWQGNPVFNPVLEELHRRKAVVFCHPRPAACCTRLMPDVAPNETLLVEFPYDTGRAVVSLLMSGSFARYSGIRWVFCHSGDVVPVLSGRWNNAIKEMSAEELAKIAPQGINHELQRQFFDTADGAYKPSMDALLDYVPATQVMFGTDYPYVTIESNVGEIRARRFPAPELRAIQRENALRLMPGLA